MITDTVTTTATATATTGSVPRMTVSPVRIIHPKRYKDGVNVLVMWDKKSWYLCHVVEFKDDSYTVYCPEDGAVKKGVTPDKVRPSTAGVPTRYDMVNAEFWFEGDDEIPAGRWKVRQLIHRKNEYRCCRLSDAPVGTPNIDNFDIF